MLLKLKSKESNSSQEKMIPLDFKNNFNDYKNARLSKFQKCNAPIDSTATPIKRSSLGGDFQQLPSAYTPHSSMPIIGGFSSVVLQRRQSMMNIPKLRVLQQQTSNISQQNNDNRNQKDLANYSSQQSLQLDTPHNEFANEQQENRKELKLSEFSHSRRLSQGTLQTTKNFYPQFSSNKSQDFFSSVLASSAAPFLESSENEKAVEPADQRSSQQQKFIKVLSPQYFSHRTIMQPSRWQMQPLQSGRQSKYLKKLSQRSCSMQGDDDLRASLWQSSQQSYNNLHAMQTNFQKQEFDKRDGQVLSQKIVTTKQSDLSDRYYKIYSRSVYNKDSLKFQKSQQIKALSKSQSLQLHKQAIFEALSGTENTECTLNSPKTVDLGYLNTFYTYSGKQTQSEQLKSDSFHFNSFTIRGVQDKQRELLQVQNSSLNSPKQVVIINNSYHRAQKSVDFIKKLYPTLN